MIVLLHLGGDPVLAEVVRRGDQDRLDLRTTLVYPDGHKDVIEVFGARRGVEDGQWQDLPGAELPAAPVVVVEPDPVVQVVEIAPCEAPRMPGLLRRVP